MNFIEQLTTRWGTAILATLVLVAGLTTTAQADAVSYSMMLCENLNVLSDPGNSLIAHNAAWNSQHTIMLQRTTPYLEVKNTSATASITKLTMSIGDTTKNFDWATLVTASPGVTFSVVGLDAVAGGQKTDLLQLTFNNFGPNDFVRFRVGLSPDNPAANPIIDYRSVFFHMNGGTDVSANSVLNTTFQSAAGATTLTNALPNFEFEYATSTSLVPTDLYGEDEIEIFSTPAFSGSIHQIPEPGGLLLLGMGLLGFAVLKRRRPL